MGDAARQLDMFAGSTPAPVTPPRPAHPPHCMCDRPDAVLSPGVDCTPLDWSLGGPFRIDRRIPCVACGKPTLVAVFTDSNYRSADPRGVGDHARVSIDPTEHGYEVGTVQHACWDCIYEHEREGYDRVLDRAAKAGGWRKSASAATVSAPANDSGLPTRSIDDDVLRVLSACAIEADKVRLPPKQLERKLYTRVDEVLRALGGKWNKRAKAHVFAESPADVLDAAITSGRIVLPKDLGWFPTPDALAREVVAMADVRKGMLALEPSAGEGAIARALRDAGTVVHCYEIDPGRRDKLRADGFTVTLGDFMALPVTRMFDRVVMNPPFGKRADVKHVTHAFAMLLPGGKLVAIMSGGVAFRDDRECTEFRELVTASRGSITPLPDGSFTESGTGVRTVVVTMEAA